MKYTFITPLQCSTRRSYDIIQINAISAGVEVATNTSENAPCFELQLNKAAAESRAEVRPFQCESSTIWSLLVFILTAGCTFDITRGTKTRSAALKTIKMRRRKVLYPNIYINIAHIDFLHRAVFFFPPASGSLDVNDLVKWNWLLKQWCKANERLMS